MFTAVSDFSADGVSIGTGRRVDSGISCGGMIPFDAPSMSEYTQLTSTSLKLHLCPRKC